MLTFDNVRFQYAVENFSIIDHLSFEVQDGEFVSIIGASGRGHRPCRSERLWKKYDLPAGK